MLECQRIMLVTVNEQIPDRGDKCVGFVATVELNPENTDLRPYPRLVWQKSSVSSS